MRKIVSNVLIVSVQLIVGGLFLFMLFSDNNEGNRLVVVENNNLDKMADAVSELFEVNNLEKDAKVVDLEKEEELIDAEQKRLEEEAKAKALAEAEALRKAKEEAELKAKEEAEKKAREEASKLIEVDTTGYTSKPELGFNVTVGNKTYDLSDEDFGILAAVVSCEANRNSKDDILAVVSVILNRTDSSRYPNDPVSVVAAPGQFSCYKGNSIEPSETVAKVIKDALNGIRNNKYYGFRSWATTSYSDNYIIERGNRYK